jgi:hypothetical protein
MLRDSLEHREHAGPAADAFDAHRATKRTGRVIGPFDQSTGFLGAAQPGGKLVVATRSLVPWRRRPAERQVVAGGGTRPVDAECVPPPPHEARHMSPTGSAVDPSRRLTRAATES